MPLAPLKLVAAMALALACLALPAAARAEIAVRHVQGETVLPERPKTVLVFDLAALDTLDRLGVPVAGVPGSNLPEYLAKYRDKQYLKIGTLFEPDFEAVHAAAPDLIIVGGRSAPKYAELARIAPTIDLTVDPSRYVESVRRNTETLGRIFGREKEAGALEAKLDGAMARVRALAPEAGRSLVILTTGGKVSAYGKGTRFGWVHSDLGFAQAAEGLTIATHGEPVSFEFILKTNPDTLFVIDRDAAIGRAGSSAKKTLDNDLVAATKAARNNRIVYVDPALWYIVGGGVGALTTAVEEIGDALRRAS
ncbi:siderophore ABC transporter substrate-binding protein [Propylenella binzhouense]|uniref:Siderophore ABC transporter substrate-binding protein n=1 Tax=Propylenella binzhouense TaxID=2555902 RepID=A0A964T2M4_9HYPH|nr:siderophore ABC transporter substrate-binding protein [Propylenella binzhouense]MYZ46784.1 siderophore ABC transporter substrate-binding protein [Propylenella binzhouense]